MQKGFTLWFTGLSGAGKSTLAGQDKTECGTHDIGKGKRKPA